MLGWAAVIKGAVLLIAPGCMVKKMDFWMPYIRYGGVFAILIGGMLVYFGFGG